MAKIFISYRRDDSQYQADKLHAALKPYVANPKTDIFIDIDNIPLGVDFGLYLDQKVAECDVLLAVIGKSWSSARNPKTGQRRLDDPADFVRIEIAAALKRGVPVVPVLLDGAPVPEADELPDDLKGLALRNGLPLARTSFESDVARLVAGLPIQLSVGGKSRFPDMLPLQSTRRTTLSVGLAIVGIGLMALMLRSLNWNASGERSVPFDEVNSEYIAPIVTDPNELFDAGREPFANNRCSKLNQITEVYFEFGRSDLTPQAINLIEQTIANTIADPLCQIVRVDIDGHADPSEHFNDEPKSSIELSRSRAVRVAEALYARDVDNEAIDLRWFGKSKAVSWAGDEVQHLNRRAEVTIFMDERS